MLLPLIETARLRLRPFMPDDLDVLLRFWTDSEVRRYLWDGRTVSREQAEAVLQSSLVSFQTHGFGHWAVIHARHGSPPSGRSRASGKTPGCSRSEEHTSELQSRPHLVCRLLLEKKKTHGKCLSHSIHAYKKQTALSANNLSFLTAYF